jgi:ribosomal protein S12 methylthiotransferase
MYTYPKYFTDELINFLAGSCKVVKYLDIPLQHAHPDILKAMNRPNVDIQLLLSKLRNRIEGVAIRTCFIVGFPGETKEHFDYLYNFVEEQKFERLGVFEYSKEKGTPAAKMQGQVKVKVKKAWRKALMQLQQQISLANHQKLEGKRLDVLIEKISDSGSATGRSYLDAPEIDGLVYVNSAGGYLPGDIIPVKITKVTAYDLYGVLEN